jgi:hypothetical protein
VIDAFCAARATWFVCIIRPVNDPSISYEGGIMIGGGVGAQGPLGAHGAAEAIHGRVIVCKIREMPSVNARDFFMKQGLKNIPRILGIF